MQKGKRDSLFDSIIPCLYHEADGVHCTSNLYRIKTQCFTKEVNKMITPINTTRLESYPFKHRLLAELLSFLKRLQINQSWMRPLDTCLSENEKRCRSRANKTKNYPQRDTRLVHRETENRFLRTYLPKKLVQKHFIIDIPAKTVFRTVIISKFQLWNFQYWNHILMRSNFKDWDHTCFLLWLDFIIVANYSCSYQMFGPIGKHLHLIQYN